MALGDLSLTSRNTPVHARAVAVQSDQCFDGVSKGNRAAQKRGLLFSLGLSSAELRAEGDTTLAQGMRSVCT